MKRVYWRPQKISKLALFVIGLVAVGGTLAIEHFPVTRGSGNRQTKIVAAGLAQRGMQAIHDARLEQGLEIDRHFDPTQSGMVGTAMSAVTSLPGHLDAKQTSVNPNFAAVAVELLGKSNVKKGDLVAVGYTGSFPALNTCLCAAIEAIGAEPIVIHSAASSQFGANEPTMMWLDMESTLYDEGIISFRSTAATLGGFGDRARGMSDESQALLNDSISRNNVAAMTPSSLKQSIRMRMELYSREAAGRPIAAYVNVGGGAASIHGDEGREAFGGGLVEGIPGEVEDVDCVASRFAQQGVPVVNLGNVVSLAKKFKLPIAPQSLPAVGTGSVFVASGPSRLVAALLLVGVLGMVRAYVWTDLWSRLRSKFTHTATPPQELRIAGAELMV